MLSSQALVIYRFPEQDTVFIPAWGLGMDI
jgi:hypothetical protein